VIQVKKKKERKGKKSSFSLNYLINKTIHFSGDSIEKKFFFINDSILFISKKKKNFIL
jgi:hypothetical protein